MISAHDRWHAIVDDFGCSGLTVRGFCERRGIAVSTFHQWRRRLRDVAEPVRRGGTFVEAMIQRDIEPTISVAPIVELRCGRRVVVPWGFDETTLARVIGVLERLEAEAPSGDVA